MKGDVYIVLLCYFLTLQLKTLKGTVVPHTTNRLCCNVVLFRGNCNPDFVILKSLYEDQGDPIQNCKF